MHTAPPTCPVCGGELAIRELKCEVCDTEIHGQFTMVSNRYSALDAKQSEFLEVFLRHRGVLSSIGDELKISYPTVRSRLDALLSALGLAPAPERTERDEAVSKKKAEIIEKLERGELNAEEAKAALRETR